MYKGLAFRLNGVCVELENSDSDLRQGAYTMARLCRQFVIRIYGTGRLGLVTLLTALGNLPSVQVADAEKPQADLTDGVDTRHFLVRFQQEECPTELRGIMELDIRDYHLTLHHYLLHQRMPCGRCGAPYHTTGFCKTKVEHLGKMHGKYRRRYDGAVPTDQVGDAIHYRHPDGECLAVFLTTL
ncbi:hypothetical protein PF005_g15000 [Phytophthora fragariae]|uniref:Uncharacterized protein n=1 Tax=Phytophthora fragariae TaxID=53985 RepID=A0A6A3YDW1_9STRA|nr:hypothetical protein PF003_g2165 [Phytophthora fragariae]KAE8933453.1 hypothetical protein PF009_g16544 [Phytophthora fragariae]KAE9201324.1 hypothetical protein PF005_g15000 [Phytophthora fragariae]KAE9217057.1 hypothetical protein PF002_g16911 [Phytophthora fragariae]KAE9332067.1 hypothetical protein PF008_g15119 [Phytophthora fragariae]